MLSIRTQSSVISFTVDQLWAVAHKKGTVAKKLGKKEQLTASVVPQGLLFEPKPFWNQFKFEVSRIP